MFIIEDVTSHQHSLQPGAEETPGRPKKHVTVNELLEIDSRWTSSFSTSDLPEVLLRLKQGGDENSLFASYALRKILSTDQTFPERFVPDILPSLHTWLQRADLPRLQVEAAWVLGNLASGAHSVCRSIIDAGFVPQLINFLSPVGEVQLNMRCQVLLALGNLGGDSAYCRDFLLISGVQPFLIETLHRTSDLNEKKHCLWVLSNLCRGKPSPYHALVACAVPVFAKHMKTLENLEALTECCWALAALSYEEEDSAQVIIDEEAGPSLVALLQHPRLQAPALRVLANLAAGNEEHTQYVIDCGVLEKIHGLLTSERRAIRAEAVRLISSIAAGTQQQVLCLSTAKVFPVLLSLLSLSEECRGDILWTFANSMGDCTPDLAKELLHMGTIQALSDKLEDPHPEFLAISFTALLCALLDDTCSCNSKHEDQDDREAQKT